MTKINYGRYHLNSIAAAALVDRAAKELAATTPDMYKPTHHKTELLWVSINRQPVSVIAWERYWNGGQIWAFIGLAYTVPEHRQKGYYKQLVHKLSNLARIFHLAGLLAAVPEENKVSLMTHRAIGMQPYATEEGVISLEMKL